MAEESGEVDPFWRKIMVLNRFLRRAPRALERLTFKLACALCLTAAASTCRAQSRHHEALSTLYAAVRLDPKSQPTRYHLANALYLSGRYDEAEPQARKAVALAPEDAQALLLDSLILAHLGRFEKALEQADRALKLEPGNVEINTHTTHMLYCLARYDDVFTLTGPIRSGESAEMASYRAASLINLGRGPEALAAAEHVVALEPSDQAKAFVAESQQMAGHDSAAAVTARGLLDGPKAADAHYVLGTVARDAGNREEALGEFRKAENRYIEDHRILRARRVCANDALAQVRAEIAKLK